MTGYLILENGEIFEGERIGYNADAVMELVLNDENFGYIETITDPSYYGQGIVFSYPLIGNYGIVPEYCESDGIWVQGIFIQEIAEFESNVPSKINFDKYLRDLKIPGLCGIDVKKIESIIKSEGTLNAYLTSTINNIDTIMEKIKNYRIENPVKQVTSKQIRVYGRGKEKRIALLDYGFKHSIVNSLLKRNVEIHIFPANTSAEVILNSNPDGIVISNGPGNPEKFENLNSVKKLLDKDIPILGIGLGHQVIAISSGFKTKKLKYGHRGINYTVKDLRRNRIYVTSQNHQYVVDEDTVKPNVADILYRNLCDNTIAGLVYKNKNVLTVQFEPEACPGPLDTNFIFDNFIKKI